MAELQKTLDLINHKRWYYETALETGTEKIHLKAHNKDNFENKLSCEDK